MQEHHQGQIVSAFFRGLLLAICIIVPAGPLRAADDGPEMTPEAAAILRVELATRQRKLVHKIAKATCFSLSLSNADLNAQAARDAVVELDGIMLILDEGGGEVALAPETDPGVRVTLGALQETWGSLGAAIRQLLAGDLHSVVMAQALRLNGPMATQADDSLQRIIEVHRSAMKARQKMLSTVDVASRQALLVQRAAKEMCYISLDINQQEMRSDLAETVALFETSMTALEYGDYDMAVIDPPSLAFLAKIAQLRDAWAAFRVPLEGTLDGGVPSPEELALVEELNRGLAQTATELVALYLE